LKAFFGKFRFTQFLVAYAAEVKGVSLAPGIAAIWMLGAVKDVTKGSAWVRNSAEGV
jgi:hypothetical protein